MLGYAAPGRGTARMKSAASTPPTAVRRAPRDLGTICLATIVMSPPFTVIIGPLSSRPDAIPAASP